MDPEKSYREIAAEDMFQHFLLSLIGVTCFVLIVILIYKCCCEEEERQKEVPPPRNTFPITPIYAQELEPGLVVLQSANGEYFRILQEYNATKEPTNQRGLTDFTEGQGRNSLHYVPHYTSAHFQTQPSAPVSQENLLLNIDTEHPRPPPYYTK